MTLARPSAVLGLAGLLLAAQPAAAQPAPAPAEDKANLEIDKLRLEKEKLTRENQKLERDANSFPFWERVAVPLGSVLGIVVTAWLSIRAATRQRLGERDQAVHEARLAAYPKLVQATAPLAVFFPPKGDQKTFKLDRDGCERIGAALSGWYFEHGGLLLSEASRGAYFRLAEALAKASRMPGDLKAPVFSRDTADLMTLKTLEEYRRALGLTNPTDADVGGWTFRGDNPLTDPERFRDYVLLQTLSSRLRSALTEDINSRRRPDE